MSNPGEILTVTELNHTAKVLLEEHIGLLWVQGEISNFSVPSSGHWYFSLKDQAAQIRCAMFAGRNRQVSFEPKHGQQVLVYGQVSLYENRGDFQLIVEKMESVGEGALQIAFEKLTRKLSAEGLFEPRHKKSIPSHPRCIGLITSATGAALRDMLHVLKRRAPHIPIIIYPTAVQGDQASKQIAQAISIANQRAECDVLILARGGGSLEDLWPFNEESVARAIFESDLPLVSGIGHEVDFTISDWAADLRAPTPSAAAELVSPDTPALWQLAKTLEQRLCFLVRQNLARHQQNLSYLEKRLKHPKEILMALRQQFDYQELHLTQLINTKITQVQQRFSLLTEKLNQLNPLVVLNRGYAFITNEEKEVISSIQELKFKQKIHLQLADGEALAIVSDLHEKIKSSADS